jgi:hypothetical protein
VVLVGGASGKLKGGRHLRNTSKTTMSNLLLAVLDKMDIRQEKFGDSTAMMALRNLILAVAADQRCERAK